MLKKSKNKLSKKERKICRASIFSFLIVTIIISGLIEILSYDYYSYDSNIPISNSLLLSSITPQNKTYTKGDSGYYPSTFGFENDINGNIPNGFNDTSQINTYAKIIDNFEGHKKVLECYSSSSSSSYLRLRNDFEEQTNGSIEFWVYKSAGYDNGPAIIYIRGTNEMPLVSLIIGDDYRNNFEYEGTGDYWNCVDTGFDFHTDQWIHVRIDIDCDSDNFDLYLNNSLYVKNQQFRREIVADGFYSFGLTSFDSVNPVKYYIDGIGYSWDKNYNIGDNLNEGLLVNYINNTNTDWVGFSLDGQTNITIQGKKTIKLPIDGFHSFQIHANNTFGECYSSNKIYFTVNRNGDIDNWLDNPSSLVLLVLFSITVIGLIIYYEFSKSVNRIRNPITSNIHNIKQNNNFQNQNNTENLSTDKIRSIYTKINEFKNEFDNSINLRNFDTAQSILKNSEEILEGIDFLERRQFFGIISSMRNKMKISEQEELLKMNLLDFANKYPRIHIIEISNQINMPIEKIEITIKSLISKGEISAEYDEKSKGITFLYALEEIDSLMKTYKGWESKTKSKKN